MSTYDAMWSILMGIGVLCFVALGLGVLMDKIKERDENSDHEL